MARAMRLGLLALGLAAGSVCGMCDPPAPDALTVAARALELAGVAPKLRAATLATMAAELSQAGGRGLTEGEEDKTEGGFADLTKPSALISLGMVVLCVCSAALAAGLTMGLVSLDPLDLKVKARGGNASDRRSAAKLLPLIDDTYEDSHAKDGNGEYRRLNADEAEAQREQRESKSKCCHASRHHFILVTFLLFNSLANEALPLFLDKLVPGWIAVILSVTLVLFFGEIIPSAIFTGPSQLRIAAAMTPFVRLMMIVLSPVAYPIAYALDIWLGHQSLRKYTRDEISALVRVQHEIREQRESMRRADEQFGRSPGGSLRKSMDSVSRESATHHHDDGALMASRVRPSDGLTVDEVDIVAGVLATAEKSVFQAMTPIDDVYSLSLDGCMDFRTMSEVMGSGFSRIPVSAPGDPGDLRGFLLVKRLITLDPNEPKTIRGLSVILPACVAPAASLLETLNRFQEGRSHMAFVSPDPRETRRRLMTGKPLEGTSRPLGILTLEDIVEKIIQEEIYDEDDLMIREVHDVMNERLRAWRGMLARGQPPKARSGNVFKGNRNFQSMDSRGGKLMVNPQAMNDLTGKLSKNLLEHLLQAFRIFDRDSDGHITAEELDQVMRSFGQEPTEEELASMMAVVDLDGDGAVDFQEFVEMLTMAESSEETKQRERKEAQGKKTHVGGATMKTLVNAFASTKKSVKESGLLLDKSSRTSPPGAGQPSTKVGGYGAVDASTAPLLKQAP